MGAIAMKYAVVIERAGSNYSAYVPDLPGCVATGSTVDEVRESLSEAVVLHLEGMREDGESIPPATTVCEYLAVA
jgi:predicted RNase H-like HicB family nuclease